MGFLEWGGKQWRVLTGMKAKDSKEKALGEITDHFVDAGEMIFEINGEFEISAIDVEEFIYPECYVRITS